MRTSLSGNVFGGSQSVSLFVCGLPLATSFTSLFSWLCGTDTNAAQDELYLQLKDGLYGVYAINDNRCRTRFGTLYTRILDWVTGVEPTRLASVRPLSADVATYHSLAALPIVRYLTAGFWATLHSWENQSLCWNLQCNGDGSWIWRAIVLHLLVAVHDGSYMPKVAQHMSAHRLPSGLHMGGVHVGPLS